MRVEWHVLYGTLRNHVAQHKRISSAPTTAVWLSFWPPPGYPSLEGRGRPYFYLIADSPSDAV